MTLIKCTLSNKCPDLFCPHSTPHEKRGDCDFNVCVDYLRGAPVSRIRDGKRECAEVATDAPAPTSRPA